MTTTEKLANEVDELSNAINWLNDEITIQQPQQFDYRPRLESLNADIIEQRKVIKNIRAEQAKILSANQELQKRENLRDQIIKAKLSVEIYLEEIISEGSIEQSDDVIDSLKEKISVLRIELKKYSITQKIGNAEDLLTSTMNSIGKNLDFEAFYKKPLNINFSLESFDVWLVANKEKIYLRSMGSGANWLYCHLSLFLAFQKLFCSLGDNCAIPPILFIDQPTQVYFPNVTNDTDEDKFDARKLASSGRKNKINDDIECVENFFNELLLSVKVLKKKQGMSRKL